MIDLRRATVFFATLALAACGGSTTEPEGGGDGGGGGGDDSSAPTNPACPAQPPSSGTACSGNSPACEYGSSPYAECNTIATCPNGTWYVNPPTDYATNCGATPSPSCPSSYASVPSGQTCTPYGLECNYAEGTCACTIPEGPPRAEPDGGPAPATWICVAPSAGCPATRPRLGSSCSQAGLTCDYGACTLPDGQTEICVGGYWQSEGSACPALAN